MQGETEAIEFAPIEKRDTNRPIPLTALQTRWLKYRGRVAMRAYSGPSTLTRTCGRLDIEHLQESIAAVVRRHDSLRTRIIEVDGVQQQHVDSVFGNKLEVVNLSSKTAARVAEDINDYANDFFSEKTDISTAPPLAAKLLRISDDDNVLMISLDHMVSDGVSNDILHNEIWTVYGNSAETMLLPELPLQFADYTSWQERTYAAWLSRHAAYWRERLTGIQPLSIPVRDHLDELTNPTGAELEVQFGEILSTRLRGLARHEKTMLALVVLAVYVAVMARWCERQDLLVVLQSNGRYRPELANMIGFITTCHYMRIEIRNNDTFQDLLKRVTTEFYSAYDHFDFDRAPDLVPECWTELGFGWTPARGERIATEAMRAQEQLRLEARPFKGVPHNKFETNFFDGSTGIYCNCTYRPDIFARSSVERFTDSLRQVAEQCAEQPHRRVASISMFL